MRRLLKGFLIGIVIGAVLAWLCQRYLWRKPETVPARPGPVEAPPEMVPIRTAPVKVPPDDLAALRGIGPAFALRLQQAGIHTYADLARLTPEEVAERCQVPSWRIRRDNWIGQAAALGD